MPIVPFPAAVSAMAVSHLVPTASPPDDGAYSSVVAPQLRLPRIFEVFPEIAWPCQFEMAMSVVRDRCIRLSTNFLTEAESTGKLPRDHKNTQLKANAAQAYLHDVRRLKSGIQPPLKVYGTRRQVVVMGIPQVSPVFHVRASLVE
jgi:hypothetical protein